MTRLLKPWMVLCVLGLSVFVSGQNGCNAVVNPGGGGGGGGGGDPLAPLTPRICGTWSGRFTGTLRSELPTVPWSSVPGWMTFPWLRSNRCRPNVPT